jgi:hypothetical protein
MTKYTFFPQINVQREFPGLPFNYHEPMTSISKDGKEYRVYYTMARDTHIVIIEAYNG